MNGSGRGIFGRRFDSSGTALGAEFMVNSYTLTSQRLPTVGLDGNGVPKSETRVSIPRAPSARLACGPRRRLSASRFDRRTSPKAPCDEGSGRSAESMGA